MNTAGIFSDKHDDGLRKRRRSRGSLFVVAACCLPVFIISICLILTLTCQAGLEETMYTEMNQRTLLWKNTDLSSDDPALSFLFLPSIGNLAGIPGSQCVICSSEMYMETDRKLVYRSFGGETDYAKEEGVTVYIFPKYGTKYHLPGCWTMEMYPDNYEALSEKEAEERGYTKCRICFP